MLNPVYCSALETLYITSVQPFKLGQKFHNQNQKVSYIENFYIFAASKTKINYGN